MQDNTQDDLALTFMSPDFNQNLQRICFWSAILITDHFSLYDIS